MTVHVSTFPDQIEVRATQPPTYGWTVVIDLGGGNHLYLTDEQADALAESLWNRHIEQRAAA